MTYLQAFSPLQTSRSALRVTLSLHVRPVGELLPCSSLPTAQLRLGGFTHTVGARASAVLLLEGVFAYCKITHQLSKSLCSLRNLEPFIMSLNLTPQGR